MQKQNGGRKADCPTTGAQDDSSRSSEAPRSGAEDSNATGVSGPGKSGNSAPQIVRVAGNSVTGELSDNGGTAISAGGNSASAGVGEGEIERPHHPYSPSWLQYGEACALYRSKDSKHVRTIAGTIAHKAAERQEDDDRLSDDDAVAVAECLDFYDGRKRQMESAAHRAFENAVSECVSVGLRRNDSLSPNQEEFKIVEGTETYLPIDDLKFSDCESTTAGYVDRWILSHDKTYAEIIDWKFGKWPVEEASNNLQGMAYALGIFRMFPTVKSVHVFFKQPLIKYLTDAVFTRADIADIYLRIQIIVERARIARAKAAHGDWSDANPAVPLCNFCAKIGDCPKVLEFACKVGHKFHPLGIPDNVNPSLIQDPRNTKLAMELASVMKVWGDAFRRQVADRVIRGDAVMPEGYTHQTIQKRELVDMEIYKKLARKYLSAREWEECLDTTFGAVEKKIMFKTERGSKESTVKEFQDLAAQQGATKLGEPISFLKVKSKNEKQTN